MTSEQKGYRQALNTSFQWKLILYNAKGIKENLTKGTYVHTSMMFNGKTYFTHEYGMRLLLYFVHSQHTRF